MRWSNPKLRKLRQRPSSGYYPFVANGFTVGIYNSSGVLQRLTPPQPLSSVGQFTFDGQGTFTRVDFNVGNGVPANDTSTPVNKSGFPNWPDRHVFDQRGLHGKLALSVSGALIQYQLVVVDFGEHGRSSRQSPVPRLPQSATRHGLQRGLRRRRQYPRRSQEGCLPPLICEAGRDGCPAAGCAEHSRTRLPCLRPIQGTSKLGECLPQSYQTVIATQLRDCSGWYVRHVPQMQPHRRLSCGRPCDDVQGSKSACGGYASGCGAAVAPASGGG